MMTITGMEIDDNLVRNHISGLISKFYKILPIKENGEPTMKQYLHSLQHEMIGCSHLVVALHEDDRYLTLLGILQYFIDFDPDVTEVRRDVFRAINILKKMKVKYCCNKG